MERLQKGQQAIPWSWGRAALSPTTLQIEEPVVALTSVDRPLHAQDRRSQEALASSAPVYRGPVIQHGCAQVQAPRGQLRPWGTGRGQRIPLTFSSRGMFPECFIQSLWRCAVSLSNQLHGLQTPGLLSYALLPLPLLPCPTSPSTWCLWGCTFSEVLACQPLPWALFSGEPRLRQHSSWEIEKEQENKLGEKK